MIRKSPKMPVELIAHHPKALALGNAGFGQLMRLILHFWLTDCAPLPTVDHQLYILTRGHIATWKANRVEIKEILQDVIPVLAKSHARASQHGKWLTELRGRAASAKRAARLEKTINSPPLIEKTYEPLRAERNRSTAQATTPAAGPKSGFRETIR